MNQTATITSKMQLTIPISIAKKLGVKSGERVNVIEKEGQIVITPFKRIIDEFAGSLKVPRNMQGKNLDEVIKQAKSTYFQSKYKTKKA